MVSFGREFITNIRDWALRADVDKIGPLGQYALQVGPLKWTLSTIDKSDNWSANYHQEKFYQKKLEELEAK